MTDDSTLSESGTPERAPESDNFPVLAGARSTSCSSAIRRPATTLGDHRFDDRLTDLSPAALDDEQRWVGRRLADLLGSPVRRTFTPADRGWTPRSSPTR